MIPFECNHLSLHAAAPAKNPVGRRSLGSRGWKRGRRVLAPAQGFPLPVGEVPPAQETLNFCARSQRRKWGAEEARGH